MNIHKKITPNYDFKISYFVANKLKLCKRAFG